MGRSFGPVRLSFWGARRIEPASHMPLIELAGIELVTCMRRRVCGSTRNNQKRIVHKPRLAKQYQAVSLLGTFSTRKSQTRQTLARPRLESYVQFSTVPAGKKFGVPCAISSNLRPGICFVTVWKNCAIILYHPFQDAFSVIKQSDKRPAMPPPPAPPPAPRRPGTHLNHSEISNAQRRKCNRHFGRSVCRHRPASFHT